MTIFIVSLLALSPASDVVAQEPPPDAVSELVRCIADRQQLAVVLLIDESKSLRTTDPDASRVSLGQSLVEALNLVSSIPIDGQPSRLDVAVVGFGSSVNVDDQPVSPGDWVTVDSDATVTQVLSSVDRFRDRNGDNNTDYVDALAQAQTLLVERSVAVNPADPSQVCSAVLWFTDGRFDLTVSQDRRWWAQDLPMDTVEGTTRAIERGESLLCAPEGVADQLRRGGTFLLTFALLSDGFAGNDEALLRNVTLGESGCGQASTSGQGAYFADRGVEGLVDCFFLTLANGKCTETPVENTCDAASPCVETFIIDDSVGSFAAVVSASPDLMQTSLIAPSGTRVSLGSDQQGTGDTTLDGVELSIVSSSRSSLISGVVPVGAQSAWGQWTVEHAPQTSGSMRLTVDLVSAYGLDVVAPPSLLRGEPAQATVNVTGRSGEPVALSDDFAEPVLTARLTDGGSVIELSPTPTGDGSFVIDLIAPLSGDATSVTLDVSASAATSDGSVLDLGRRSIDLPAYQEGFPIPPAAITFGVLNAQREDQRDDNGVQAVKPLETTTSPMFTGDANRDGQVCLDSTDLIGGSSSEVQLTAAIACVDVPAGATVEFPMALFIDGPGAGPLVGNAEFRLISSSGDERFAVLDVNGQVVVPLPDPVTDDALAWILFVVAVLLPLLLFCALGWWTSRFKDPTLVRALPTRVQLTVGGLSAFGSVDADDPALEHLTSGAGQRTAYGLGLSFRSPVRVIRIPTVSVTASSGAPVVIGSEGTVRTMRDRFRREKRVAGKIAHQLHRQWVFVPDTDSTGSSITGKLTVLLRGDVASSTIRGESSSARSEVFESASQTLAIDFESIRRLLEEQRGSGDGSDETSIEDQEFTSRFTTKRS